MTAVAVGKLKKPGRYAVGDGAYLQIATGGTKSWLFRYKRDGKARHMGLGPYSLLTLAEAREKARQARRALLEGIDPLEAKAARRARARLDAARGMTFRQCAERMIASHEAAWKNPEASSPMEGDARHLCVSGVRGSVGQRHRYGARSEGA